MHGDGTIYKPDGTIFIGTWYLDQIEGVYTIIDNDGKMSLKKQEFKKEIQKVKKEEVRTELNKEEVKTC